MEMSEYYLPMNGANTHYHRASGPFPISPAPFRPPDHCSSGEGVGKSSNLRPTSSSSMESNAIGHGQSEEASPVYSNSKEEYSEEMVKSEKFGLSGRDTSPDSKTGTGRRLSVKVSEKRRQQNRAAQRAMRERRKRAAQHQEIHMTAIMTENAILREKVTYLSNLLLSHAIAPAGHLPWSSMPHQETSPPMLPPLNTANPPTRPMPSASSSSASPLSFPNHPLFPAANLAGPDAFHQPQPSFLNYYPATVGPLELEYIRQGHHVPGPRNLSCPSSSSNLSRPSTADEPVTC